MWTAIAIGAVAAVSIYLGMPLALSARISARLRTGLTAATVGLLLFLFYDILSTTHDLVVARLSLSPAGAVADAVLLASGFLAGLVVLPAALGQLARRPLQPTPPPASRPASPVRAVPISQFGASTMTAIAIGVHNFSEGLAVGVAFAGGVAALSVLLAVGVVAHKSAEGYCICGCAGDAVRGYSRIRLGALGLIGGGPVLVGTAVGTFVGIDPTVLIAVLGLAAGAVLYVVLTILGSGLLDRARAIVPAAIFLGFFAGYATDLTLTALGL